MDESLKTQLQATLGHDSGIHVYQHRLLMPDGSIKCLRDLAHRVRDEAGHDDVVGAIVDITERKIAEEAIRRGEAYLAAAQALSHTGSFG
jgi:PAS domain S-box-containing protein